ncbi:type III polyketide synthase, partial [Bacillus rhizoplanae]
MPKIISVGICPPSHIINQKTVVHFAKDLFGDSFKDIKRLLQVFENGQIEKRHIAKELSWFENDHTFEEKNNAYIECSIKLGAQAIENCVTNKTFLKQNMKLEEIEALFYISSTGLATPTIDARIMNVLSFSSHTKRIPLWG